MDWTIINSKGSKDSVLLPSTRLTKRVYTSTGATSRRDLLEAFHGEDIDTVEKVLRGTDARRSSVEGEIRRK